VYIGPQMVKIGLVFSPTHCVEGPVLSQMPESEQYSNAFRHGNNLLEAFL